MNINTLQYWHKLEFFYPYTISEYDSDWIKSYSINDLNCDTFFPDYKTPSCPPERKVKFYKVCLGIFPVDNALAALEKNLGKMKFRDHDKENKSCFCEFSLDKDGLFLKESFKISAFPWAVHRIREGKILIDNWDDDFHAFESALFMFLYNNKSEPIKYNFLKEFLKFINEKLNWKIGFDPTWLRIDMVMKQCDLTNQNNSQDLAEEELEIEEAIKQNELLNSFYIRDLEKIIRDIKQNNSSSIPFAKFISHTESNAEDIEHNSNKTYQIMHPTQLPKGKWPSNFGARFMQQVNVNLFLSQDDLPIFSVNGPPGTGKTTLLKDVIAGIVTNRAMQLCRLNRPDDAFEPKSVGVIEYQSYKNSVYKLTNNYKKFGMLVVSNNNGAVENITCELPKKLNLKNKPYNIEDYCYFNEISDLLFKQNSTWALNAAALGNKRNRTKFIESFWPYSNTDSDASATFNFNKYLKSKTSSYSQKEWDSAKKRFIQQLDKTDEIYKSISAAYNQVGLLLELSTSTNRINEDKIKFEMQYDNLLAHKHQFENQRINAEKQLDACKKNLNFMRQEIICLPVRAKLFPKKAWSIEYKNFNKQKEQLISKIIQLSKEEQEIQIDVENINQKIAIMAKEQKEIEEQISSAKHELDAFQKETKSEFRLDEYFVNDLTSNVAKSSPWDFSILNESREELFLSALQLHKAFIENSKCLRENLDAFSKWMSGVISPIKYAELIPELLHSFFIIVPVVSTTFASVGSFLRFIPNQEIPYVFIDEAGQAAPQTAAGALWRAKKAIIVGDPMQIEPVVTLHDSVIDSLCRYYGQDELIQDKYTSVQTIADHVNPYVGWRTIDDIKFRVGSPLTVHNRCQKTVFEISNEIAYNNKMIFATKFKENAVCKWINVGDNAISEHFVLEQAKEAMKIVKPLFCEFLRNQDRNDSKFPSLFIISPFRSVRAGTAKYFREHLGKEIKAECAPDIWNKAEGAIKDWIKACVGTIHTFQGKEADTVIICLGADESREGAAVWASERPNILNVAITRSKRDLYIIGNSELWGDKPYFRVALNHCNQNII